MKWYLLLFSLICTTLFACNASDTKKDAGRAGEYKRGNSSARITERKGKVELDLCFASEDCVEPCYKGTLGNAGADRFSGWIYPDLDSTSKQLVVISFSKGELSVLFPQENRDWLGMTCEPAGIYKK